MLLTAQNPSMEPRGMCFLQPFSNCGALSAYNPSLNSVSEGTRDVLPFDSFGSSESYVDSATMSTDLLRILQHQGHMDNSFPQECGSQRIVQPNSAARLGMFSVPSISAADRNISDAGNFNPLAAVFDASNTITASSSHSLDDNGSSEQGLCSDIPAYHCNMVENGSPYSSDYSLGSGAEEMANNGGRYMNGLKEEPLQKNADSYVWHASLNAAPSQAEGNSVNHNHNHLATAHRTGQENLSSFSAANCEELPPVKEAIYRMAIWRPVSIPDIITKPKRRNVRISKDPQTVAARHRRERISNKIRILQRLVPGGTKMDTASMLDEAIHYVKFLKMQVRALESLGSSTVAMDQSIGSGLNWQQNQANSFQSFLSSPFTGNTSQLV